MTRELGISGDFPAFGEVATKAESASTSVNDGVPLNKENFGNYLECLYYYEG
jgi:hypothetical protein